MAKGKGKAKGGKPVVYVASYATQDGWEAECEDPSIRESSLADVGSPQFTHVFARFGPAQRRTLQRDFLTVTEADADARRAAWTGTKPQPKEITFSHGRWEEDYGRRVLVIEARLGDEIFGAIVVQRVTVD